DEVSDAVAANFEILAQAIRDSGLIDVGTFGVSMPFSSVLPVSFGNALAIGGGDFEIVSEEPLVMTGSGFNGFAAMWFTAVATAARAPGDPILTLNLGDFTSFPE